MRLEVSRSLLALLLALTLPACERPDLFRPAAVDDLRAAQLDMTTVSLSWTARGDDGGAGRAHGYDLRWSNVFIDPVTWEDARLVNWAPRPAEPGTREEIVESAAPPRAYYALQVLDEDYNRSALSNVSFAGAAMITHMIRPDLGARPESPRFAPSGEEIAFVTVVGSSGSLVVQTPDGKPRVVTETTSPAPVPTSPTWSPDGSMLAYASDGIWTVPAAGGPPTQLLENGTEPAWSPDGDHLALIVDATLHLYTFADASLVPLTEGTLDAAPAWSPDGTTIVCRREEADEPTFTGLWLVPADGSDPLQRTSNATDAAPHWSRDEAWITFTRTDAGGRSIFAIATDDGEIVRLSYSHGTRTDDAPGWSSDGTAFAFVVNVTAADELLPGETIGSALYVAATPADLRSATRGRTTR